MKQYNLLACLHSCVQVLTFVLHLADNGGICVRYGNIKYQGREHAEQGEIFTTGVVPAGSGLVPAGSGLGSISATTDAVQCVQPCWGET